MRIRINCKFYGCDCGECHKPERGRNILFNLIQWKPRCVLLEHPRRDENGYEIPQSCQYQEKYDRPKPTVHAMRRRGE